MSSDHRDREDRLCAHKRKTNKELAPEAQAMLALGWTPARIAVNLQVNCSRVKEILKIRMEDTGGITCYRAGALRRR